MHVHFSPLMFHFVGKKKSVSWKFRIPWGIQKMCKYKSFLCKCSTIPYVRNWTLGNSKQESLWIKPLWTESTQKLHPYPSEDRRSKFKVPKNKNFHSKMRADSMNYWGKMEVCSEMIFLLINSFITNCHTLPPTILQLWGMQVKNQYCRRCSLETFRPIR